MYATSCSFPAPLTKKQCTNVWTSKKFTTTEETHKETRPLIIFDDLTDSAITVACAANALVQAFISSRQDCTSSPTTLSNSAVSPECYRQVDHIIPILRELTLAAGSTPYIVGVRRRSSSPLSLVIRCTVVCCTDQDSAMTGRSISPVCWTGTSCQLPCAR